MLPVTKIRPYVVDILLQTIQDVYHERTDACVLSLLLGLLESSIIQNKTIIIEWCLLKIKDYPIENNSNYYILYLFLITLYSNDKHKLEKIHRTVKFLNNESLEKYFLHIETFYYQKSAANF